MSEILDSGERREFETGAIRDISEGKGRCDLLPLDVLAEIFDDFELFQINKFIRTGNIADIYKAISQFALDWFDRSPLRTQDENECICTALLEVSKHYEEGCKKYGERNWEKGIPLHCFIDSAVRHYLKYLRGDDDERHDRAFLWNLLGALWTLKNKPEMNDLPFAEKEKDDAEIC